jgi:hypothetical protein
MGTKRCEGIERDLDCEMLSRPLLEGESGIAASRVARPEFVRSRSRLPGEPAPSLNATAAVQHCLRPPQERLPVVALRRLAGPVTRGGRLLGASSGSAAVASALSPR